MAYYDIFYDYKDFIPKFKDFVEVLKTPVPTHIRVNGIKAEPKSAAGQINGKEDVLFRSHPFDESLFNVKETIQPGNLVQYFLGIIQPQALTPCLAATALKPTPDSFVLDMCAAPGGKTAHMAQLMENRGLIVANDLHTGRHLALSHNLMRLGVTNTIITAYQAQEFPAREKFDFILADVPCSGEGQFRAIDERKYHMPGMRSLRFPDLQKKMLVRGFDLLKPGGTLLYATCTYNPEENESVIDHLLGIRDARLLPLDPGVPFEPGITSWRENHYDEQLRKTARFYPHQIDSVGFFMAKIGK